MIRQNAPPSTVAREAVQVRPEQQEPSEVPDVSWHLSPAAMQAAVVVVQELVTVEQMKVRHTELKMPHLTV